MTAKIHNDYLSQKEFNENSSHELQTPLAIIRNKLEMLIQSRNLDGKDMEIIESIFDAVKRLNQLNKGLLLLSKIDNRQYESDKKINFNKIIFQSLALYDEQIQEKEIIVTKETPQQDVFVEGNQVLLETLFNNLLSNAIRHNVTKGGKIDIVLSKSELKIRNTGPQLLSSPSLMFERFKKQSTSEYSIGLGLSIVKKICDVFHYRINYKYSEKNHEICITFPGHFSVLESINK
jgi:signal transduction histidine kinase